MRDQPASWDHQLRAAQRRNRQIETRMGRVQIIIIACFIVVGMTHMVDRIAAGLTADPAERAALYVENAQ